MLDTGLNMLILDTDIKGYVCHAQKIRRMRNKPPPQSHHTDSHHSAPLNPDRGTCLKRGTLSCPLPPVGSQVLLGCYLRRPVWVHPAKKSLAVTTLNPVVMSQEETTWTSVSRSNSKTMLGSRHCPEVEWAPEEGNSSAQSHWNWLCWPPAGKLQVNPELLSRRGDPRTLKNNFASKNIQGTESVTVPPKNKPELSGLLSILKHLTRSWEALGVLRLWATLSRLWDSSSAASSVRWK